MRSFGHCVFDARGEGIDGRVIGVCVLARDLQWTRFVTFGREVADGVEDETAIAWSCTSTDTE